LRNIALFSPPVRSCPSVYSLFATNLKCTLDKNPAAGKLSGRRSATALD
jgi:hypothetical protein